MIEFAVLSLQFGKGKGLNIANYLGTDQEGQGTQLFMPKTIKFSAQFQNIKVDTPFSCTPFWYTLLWLFCRSYLFNDTSQRLLMGAF